MAIRKRGHVLYRILGWIAGVCGVVGIPFISACLAVDPKVWFEKWALAGKVIDWTQNVAWILVVALPFGISLCLGMRKFIKRFWLNTGIRDILEQVQRYAFHGVKDGPSYEHRVTLFKRVRRLSEWLVIVERSGHMTRKHRTKFRIGDEPEKCEGVAGQTWAQGNEVDIPELPDVINNPSPENVRKYAAATSVAENWVKDRLAKGQKLARSYLGIPVEVEGKLWGVVILDSAQTGTIRRRATLEYYKLTSLALAKLLERN